jgi:hypothetical protein
LFGGSWEGYNLQPLQDKTENEALAGLWELFMQGHAQGYRKIALLVF